MEILGLLSVSTILIFGAIGFVVALIMRILMIMGEWKCFQKAGEPGWAAIIPIYDLWILCKISMRKNFFAFSMLIIPLIIPQIVMYIMVMIGLCKAFGKDSFGMILLMLFFPYIGFFILAKKDYKNSQRLGSKYKVVYEKIDPEEK